jgi:hypothetical protein
VYIRSDVHRNFTHVNPIQIPYLTPIELLVLIRVLLHHSNSLLLREDSKVITFARNFLPNLEIRTSDDEYRDNLISVRMETILDLRKENST